MLALYATVILIELGLLIYCVIDAAQTPAGEVRGLAKGWWIVAILIFPIVGGVAWLVSGRPQRLRLSNDRAMGLGFPAAPSAAPAPLGPDDDPAFLLHVAAAARDRNRRPKADPAAPPSSPPQPAAAPDGAEPEE